MDTSKEKKHRSSLFYDPPISIDSSDQSDDAPSADDEKLERLNRELGEPTVGNRTAVRDFAIEELAMEKNAGRKGPVKEKHADKNSPTEEHTRKKTKNKYGSDRSQYRPSGRTTATDVVLCILALFIPPLAVYLATESEGKTTLTFILWILIPVISWIVAICLILARGSAKGTKHSAAGDTQVPKKKIVTAPDETKAPTTVERPSTPPKISSTPPKLPASPSKRPPTLPKRAPPKLPSSPEVHFEEAKIDREAKIDKEAKIDEEIKTNKKAKKAAEKQAQQEAAQEAYERSYNESKEASQRLTELKAEEKEVKRELKAIKKRAKEEDKTLPWQPGTGVGGAAAGAAIGAAAVHTG